MADASDIAATDSNVAAGSTGFADPVHDAQAVFRALLGALSRPGQCAQVSVRAQPPSSFPSMLAAAALTLIDQDVCAWLSPSLRATPARDYIVFHTGSRLVAEARAADFVLCASPAEMPTLATLPQGTPEYPDRSATVLVAVGQSPAGPGVKLSGPGIEKPLPLALPGFDEAAWRHLQVNHAAYPLGVDVIVCTPQGFIGLPRSTRIEV